MIGVKNKEILEQKIGEALGLEIAAQKAVDELVARGLLDKRGIKGKIESMKKEAGTHQNHIEKLVDELSSSEELDSAKISDSAKETEQKATQMMNIYLGENPDTAEALEFLCLAEGGEVTHYEILKTLSEQVKDRKFSSQIGAILREEKQHLKLCIDMAKETVISEAK